MTDNEIIKALERCSETTGSECSECPLLNADCSAYDLYKLALDLINRQKVEIERLKHRKTELQIRNQELQHEKSEAIKEFAERLKENYCFTDRWGKIIPISTVGNLVKEMTEENEK